MKALSLFVFLSVVSALHVCGAGADLVSPIAGSSFESNSVEVTWTGGSSGRSLIYVGTTGTNSRDIFNSGFLANGVFSQTVENVPLDVLVYVRLWCETGAGTNSYQVRDYVFNSDRDSDGILDTIDPNPAVTDAMLKRAGSDHSFTILGSGRVASLVSSNLFTQTNTNMTSSQARAFAVRVYEHLNDDFDFIIFAMNQPNVPQGTYFGRFYNAQNDIEGIGKSIFDSTALFDSAGQLQGVIHLTSTNGLPGGPSLHELAHNWGNSMSSVPTAVGGHWGRSNVGGQLGGWLPNSLTDLGGGEYQVNNPRSGEPGSFGGNANGGNGLAYSQFELYTMGLIGADEVGQDIKIANDFTWVNSSQGIFSASSITTNTMADVVTMDGARIPGPQSSQKTFRVLYVMISAEELSLGEWQEFDQDVERFDRDGSDGTGSFNFWEATGGRATLKMDAITESVKRSDLIPLENFQLTNEGVARAAEVSVLTQVGKNYQLFYTPTLTGWMPGQNENGTGNVMTFSQVVGESSRMFFQIEESDEQASLQAIVGRAEVDCLCHEGQWLTAEPELIVGSLSKGGEK